MARMRELLEPVQKYETNVRGGRADLETIAAVGSKRPFYFAPVTATQAQGIGQSSVKMCWCRGTIVPRSCLYYRGPAHLVALM